MRREGAIATLEVRRGPPRASTTAAASSTRRAETQRFSYYSVCAGGGRAGGVRGARARDARRLVAEGRDSTDSGEARRGEGRLQRELRTSQGSAVGPSVVSQRAHTQNRRHSEQHRGATVARGREGERARGREGECESVKGEPDVEMEFAASWQASGNRRAGTSTRRSAAGLSRPSLVACPDSTTVSPLYPPSPPEAKLLEGWKRGRYRTATADDSCCPTTCCNSDLMIDRSLPFPIIPTIPIIPIILVSLDSRMLLGCRQSRTALELEPYQGTILKMPAVTDHPDFPDFRSSPCFHIRIGTQRPAHSTGSSDALTWTVSPFSSSPSSPLSARSYPSRMRADHDRTADPASPLVLLQPPLFAHLRRFASCKTQIPR